MRRTTPKGRLDEFPQTTEQQNGKTYGIVSKGVGYETECD